MSVQIKGYVNKGFEPVRDAFESLWNDIEIGAALCIYKGGVPIVNLWGGHTDRAATVPWQEDTLVNVYSTTKGVVALALACLIEEGKLSYEDRVIEHWPEFEGRGKGKITVAQLCAHQAGLYQFNPALSLQEMYTWNNATENLAAQKPAWTPGSDYGYHSMTWGFLVGEIIRRLTGQSPGRYIADKITSPINAEFYIGVPDSKQANCAEVVGPNHARKRLPKLSRRETPRLNNSDPLIRPFKDVSSTAWRSAEIPASNGHSSASGLAACYQLALSKEMLSRGILSRALKQQTPDTPDLVLGEPLRRAMGFILNCDACYLGPSASSFGHSGTGGSIGFADPENKVCFAYVMNQLHNIGPLRSRKLIDTFYECI